MTRAPRFSLFISCLPGLRRVAATRDGRLVRYRVFFDDGEVAGGLFLGRVSKVTSAIGAAFVDLGDGQSGFLNSRDGQVLVVDGGRITPVRQIKEGQAVLVQMMRLGQGEKLATLSAEPKLVGLCLILLPQGQGVQFSRDFKGDREALTGALEALNRELGAEPGWLVRSGSADATAEALASDGRALWAQWSQVLQGLDRGQPRLLFREDPVLRWIIEGHKQGWHAIHCDDPETVAALRTDLRERAPILASVLSCHDLELPLFDTYRLEDEIQRLEDNRVWLKSGGSLVFARTEALVTVDVNTARNTKDRDQTSSALRTNLEAVEELVCQLQARDLAGLVVVDFVNARESDWRKRVDRALGEALRGDPAKTEALPTNKFGVAMLTRQREADDAPDRLHELCGCCGGRGRVRSLERVALAVLVQLRRQAPGLDGECLKVRAGKELAAYLETHRTRFLEPLAKSYRIEIQLERAALSQRAFEIVLV